MRLAIIEGQERRQEVNLLRMTCFAVGLPALLAAGTPGVTLEIKVQYLATVTGGALAVEASVVNRTKRIGVMEAKVFGDGDRLVALATGTFYIQSART